jgi:hypothetical protein
VWKLEIERLDLIHTALEKEAARVEKELTSRAFFAVRMRELHLYIVYLKDAKPGLYSIKDPYLWPERDKGPLLSVLKVANRLPAAVSVNVRGLLAGKDRSGSPVFPVGRFDLRLAYRIATPLPRDHPALSKRKIKIPPPVLFYEEIDNGHG